MRDFYRFMAKQIPSTAWKFFWLRRVQAHLNREKTTVTAAVSSEA